MQQAERPGEPDRLPWAEPGRDLPHGGRLDAARRRFPAAPEPWIDLSTGINPLPYPLPSLPASLWTRLPEPEAIAALQAAASRRYGAPGPANVVAAPGTQALIGLLPHLLGHRSAAVLAPTYGEHAAAWRNAGATVAEVTDLADLAGLAAAPIGVLCQPNNPDGRRWPRAALLACADRLASRGGHLLVDEAFADTEPALSMAPALPHPALIVLRSFGKTYGLAGLRLGFALCDEPLARRLRAAFGPWAVSGPAAAIGTLALADDAWLAQATSGLAVAAARLDALLAAAGLTVIGGTPLFRLADSPAAPAIADRLGAAGILVRRFEAQPRWLRVGLPAGPPAWDRLERALASIKA